MSKKKYTVFITKALDIIPYNEDDEFVDGYYYSGTMNKCKEEALKKIDEVLEQNKKQLITLTEKNFKNEL
jgi:hypothetical protein